MNRLKILSSGALVVVTSLFSVIFLMNAISFFFNVSSLSAAEIIFADVPANHPNFKAIEFLKQEAVINGGPDGNFNPDKSINRAEALKIILRAFELYKPEDDKSLNASEKPGDLKFKDLKNEEWFVPYIRFALKNKIISGYADGTFGPGKDINRAEGLKIILHSSDADGALSFTKNNFSDVKAADWFNPYFSYAEEKNLLLPDENGLAQAGKALTRGELCELIYRFKMTRKNQWASYKLSMNWPMVELPFLKSRMPMPADWLQEKGETVAVLWKKDLNFGQSTAGLLYPNSARVRVFFDKPGLEMAAYFEKLREAFAGEYEVNEENKLFEIDGGDHVYLFKYLDKDQVIVLAGEVGSGSAKSLNLILVKEIMANHLVISGLTQEEKKAEILSDLNAKINLEKSGLKAINALPDAKIFFTDTIGVGTGPVDYYFSVYLDRTIKYERSLDVILGLKQGKMEKF